MQEGLEVTNLQTELNYLDSFEIYCNFSDLGFLCSGGGTGGWGISRVTNYSLYELRNVQRQRLFKENLNILISSRLIEFWCFGIPAALGRRQVGGGVWGHLGACRVSLHTCTCMCTHTHTHTHMRMHMYTCIEFANDHLHGGIHVYHVQHAWLCMHMHVSVFVQGAPPTQAHQPHTQLTHPPALPRGTPRISKNSITVELIKLFNSV